MHAFMKFSAAHGSSHLQSNYHTIILTLDNFIPQIIAEICYSLYLTLSLDNNQQCGAWYSTCFNDLVCSNVC